MNDRTIQEARDEGFDIDPCDMCQYNSLDWHEEPCESCTVGGEENHWKPSVQPTQTNTFKALETLDCISRAAAIDAIRKDMYADKDYMSAVICDGIESVLRGLPSAQPYALDEWCKDCKEYDAEQHCCPRWNRVIRETLKDAVPMRKRGKWITQEFGSWAECSECHQLYDIPIANSNFCPQCGADMREGEEE